MIGQFQWTYYEVYLHKDLPDLYPGDITFFLRGVPMMAALALRPHLKRGELRLAIRLSGFRVASDVVGIPICVCGGCRGCTATPSAGQYHYGIVISHEHQNTIIVLAWE